MKKLAFLILPFLFALPSPNLSAEEIKLASWNIRNISDASRSDAELGIISLVLFRYDFIAIQEVRTDDKAIKRIQKILKDDFQVDYEIDVSGPVGDKGERYAFLWRKDRISQTKAGSFYSDTNDQFVREPYCGSFQASSFDWTLCAVHIKFGANQADRRPEIEAMDDVYRAIKAQGQERDIITCGDFNFPPTDHGWDELKSEDLMSFAMSSPARTTIGDKSLYDNCWWPTFTSEVILGSGEVYEFDELMYPEGAVCRAWLSTHL
ncbi:MAG: endonuclease/exonuclease/phosphatase family protein [Nitrospinae bacterium]|nr:endonuclease/exonuclease/phosphatase family protein [Nitrospinota bacterium]